METIKRERMGKIQRTRKIKIKWKIRVRDKPNGPQVGDEYLIFLIINVL
jgi:hypothetical protein